VPLVTSVAAWLRSGEVPKAIPSARFRFYKSILRFDVGVVVGHIDGVPSPLIPLGIEEQHIMDSAVLCTALLMAKWST
jgi:hypothetical protein